MELPSIDESELNRVDRLGLAYCRISSYGWDDILGDKPPLYDNLPNYVPEPRVPFLKRKPSKHQYIWPAARAIRSIIGEANISRCWWKFVLGKSEDDWFHWYVGQEGPFLEKE